MPMELLEDHDLALGIWYRASLHAFSLHILQQPAVKMQLHNASEARVTKF